MTVLEVIQKSTEFLARKGVESARLQTELLLAHVLGLPRMKLYLNFDRPLTPAETDSFRELVRRRSQREPLQHITGSAAFGEWELSVNRQVLVPRPETEQLAEAGWKYLANRSPRTATALDFGTGSGCIAIALAAKCPEARIHALDISAAALEVAQRNAERCGVAGRVVFHQSDGFKALPGGLHFELIISNPPYIPSAEIAGLDPEVRDFDPRTALDGGADGLDFYRRLAVESPDWLAPGGTLMVEFGDGQEAVLPKLFGDQNWIVEAVCADYSQRPRFLIVRRG